MPTLISDYSAATCCVAATCCLLVPGGEALWLASNSCSVIGRVMGHGELVDVSVTGAQEVLAAADVNELVAVKLSTAMARHGAGAIVATGCGPGSIATADSCIADSCIADDAVKPEPPPVSSVFVRPSDTRVKVNF